jgi:hypothetical protein
MRNRPANEPMRMDLPEEPTKYEGSVQDWIGDIRGACQHDMAPRDWEGTVWDKLEDAEGQRRIVQRANKSRAQATWR